MHAALVCLVATLAPGVAPESASPGEAAADGAVVCPAAFHAALTPWAEHRQAEGHVLAYVEADQSAEEIREDIRELAEGGALAYIVLVGDTEPTGEESEPERAALCVPTHLAEAKVNIAWGSEPELATDNWYADLDDDRIPDVAIGRLPVDTPAELTALVDRILAYEQQASGGAWRRQVNVIAGVGGFGALADGLLETATKRFLTEGIPASYRTSVTYGSWQSPYCPDPREFRDFTLGRINEGCLFWVYIGHGGPYGLDYIRTPGGALPIFQYADTQRLTCAEGPPIALMLACYTAAFDAPDDCLAEQMVRTPGGPIAVVGGSRVTMPYAMATMADGLLSEYFTEEGETLGQVLLGAKRRMMATEDASEFRELLDGFAGVINPDGHDLADERREHLDLMNLLGDPLLQLTRPHAVELTVPERAESGEVIELTGTAPLTGEATVELVCRRDMFTFNPPRRGEFEASHTALMAYNTTYQQANDDRWVVQTCPIVNGEFTAQIEIPAECRGACHVRVFIEGEETCALGASDIYIRRPRPVEETAEAPE